MLLQIFKIFLGKRKSSLIKHYYNILYLSLWCVFFLFCFNVQHNHELVTSLIKLQQ